MSDIRIAVWARSDNVSENSIERREMWFKKQRVEEKQENAAVSPTRYWFDKGAYDPNYRAFVEELTDHLLEILPAKWQPGTLAFAGGFDYEAYNIDGFEVFTSKGSHVFLHRSDIDRWGKVESHIYVYVDRECVADCGFLDHGSSISDWGYNGVRDLYRRVNHQGENCTAKSQESQVQQKKEPEDKWGDILGRL